MNFKSLQKKSQPHFYSLVIDKYFPSTLRGALRYAFALLAIASFLFSFEPFSFYFGRADALFFLFTFFYLTLFFLEVFYRSMRHEGLSTRLKDGLLNNTERLDYSLSEIIFHTDEIDATRALLETKIGKKVIERCGISPNDFYTFIHSERLPIIATTINFEVEFVDLHQYLLMLYRTDKSLQQFLAKYSVNEEEFVGAARWVSDMLNKKLRKERFWSRENLGAIPSIGSSWSYGTVSDFGKFGSRFDPRHISILDVENGYREKEVLQLENVLERSQEANAIIIDDDESVARDVVERLVKRMELGVALPSIEHKEVIELDWNLLVSENKSKGELESEIIKLFNQSAEAGNVIIYVRDLPGFVLSAKNSGVNIATLLSPFLSSSSVQVIASAANSDFHYFIETSMSLLDKFERIIPESAGTEATISVLMEQVLPIEKQYKIIFSYPSLRAVATGAEKFLTYGEMPGKAVDLLVEIAPWANSMRIPFLKEGDVSEFLSQKTGITSGAISEKEAQKIENLSALMKERVVGQTEAIESVVSAVRRARSEVRNFKRPIASFLFLGSTGVGKTEVSKALADSFFGAGLGEDKNIVRFDMSEYSGPDAILRLIGDFAANKTGILASRLRDNPYSVLLLDEFEKAARDVHNLFLQILDEGVFTDALGRQVNCRNLIIIATSNAGSDLIFEEVKSGHELKKQKSKIVDTLIEKNIFKAELLNRFDGVILFEPLGQTELGQIARLAVNRLVKRLKSERDLDLEVSDEVLDNLAEMGSKEFGGRSINRAVQETVEDLISKKIISGEVGHGSKVIITLDDLKR